MPDILPALLAVLLWAVSAPVVNIGLGRLRQAPHDKKFLILIAMTTCLSAGFTVCWALNGFVNPLGAWSPNVALMGLLIFPIGTGLYYLCSLAYGDRAEVASQFANVKPAVSIMAGVLLFREPFGLHEAVVSAIIGLGIVVILSGAFHKGRQITGVMLGLALALAWAGGEILARSVSGNAASIHITLGALFSALVITAMTTFVYAVVQGKRAKLNRLKYRYFWPFLVHGVLSFGFAYMLFFESIARIGLSQTILLTVFWPMLVLVLNLIVSRVKRKPFRVPANVLTASVLFTLASLIHISWPV
ncbi:EamA family transporter [Asticcacaulis tiandongensis]|uniref:EamA family transporter n=1 Tax=Asticcacaulis tiandongensis TaxID=2565365 RepID=UPI00112A4654|nr:EamA family transporter [Asticcacaulis tiandongensis]